MPTTEAKVSARHFYLDVESRSRLADQNLANLKRLKLNMHLGKSRRGQKRRMHRFLKAVAPISLLGIGGLNKRDPKIGVLCLCKKPNLAGVEIINCKIFRGKSGGIETDQISLSIIRHHVIERLAERGNLTTYEAIANELLDIAIRAYSIAWITLMRMIAEHGKNALEKYEAEVRVPSKNGIFLGVVNPKESESLIDVRTFVDDDMTFDDQEIEKLAWSKIMEKHTFNTIAENAALSPPDEWDPEILEDIEGVIGKPLMRLI